MDRAAESKFNRYQSFKEFLQSVPCIPDPYLDVHDRQKVDALVCIHYRSNHAIMRGLTADQHRPFLSISFWNIRQPHRSILFVLVFDADGLSGKMIEYDHIDGKTVVEVGPDCGYLVLIYN